MWYRVYPLVIMTVSECLYSLGIIITASWYTQYHTLVQLLTITYGGICEKIHEFIYKYKVGIV